MNFQENPSDGRPDTAERYDATQVNYPNYRSIGTKLGNFVAHVRSVAKYEFSA
jgi:type IV secretory pathway TrbF-like protein